MHRALALLATLALAASCSAGESTPTNPPAATTTTAAVETTTTPPEATTTGPDEPAFPVTIAADNGAVTIGARPQRIVSLSPTATEMLFAIGAGDQVVAVDSFSNHPPDAPLDPDLGAFDPSVEAIVATYDPDLVVLFFDPNTVIAQFEALGVPVIAQFTPPDIEGTYRQIEQLGAATGNLAEAATEVARIQTAIAILSMEVRGVAEGVTYFHELDDSLYTITSATYFGSLYALLGLENIADAADAAGSAFGYPQLSAEYILEADPDIVFLADTICCGQSLETVAARPGWDVLTAVQAGAVVELDDDIASRWGPRVVDLLEAIAEGVRSLEPVR